MKKRVLLVICAILIIVAGAFAGWKYFFSTKANDCVQVTYEALKNIKTLSSFDFEITTDEGSLVGSLRLGKDLNSSVAYIAVNEQGGEGCLAYAEGDFALTYDEDSIYSSNEETLVYLYSDNVPGYLKEVGNSWGVDIDLNAFVADNKFNTNQIDVVLEEFRNMQPDNWEQREIKNYAEVGKMFVDAVRGPVLDDFFAETCRDKKLFKSFVSNAKVKKNGDFITYSFTVDVRNFLYAFKEYIDDGIKRHKPGFVSNALVWHAASMGLTEDYIEDIGDVRVGLIVTVDGQNILQSLTLDPQRDGEDGKKFTITIKNHNKSEVDVDKAKGFIEEARQKSK